MNRWIPLALGALLVGCTAKDKDKEEEETPNAFVGLWELTQVAETGDGGSCESEPIDVTADYPTKFISVAETSFVIATALVAYACTSETDCDKDDLFPLIALDDYDDEGGTGVYEITSGGGGSDCALSWTRMELSWVTKDTVAQVEIRNETNADVVTGADLDECSEKQATYDGAVDCGSKTILTATRVE